LTSRQFEQESTNGEKLHVDVILVCYIRNGCHI